MFVNTTQHPATTNTHINALTNTLTTSVIFSAVTETTSMAVTLINYPLPLKSGGNPALPPLNFKAIPDQHPFWTWRQHWSALIFGGTETSKKGFVILHWKVSDFLW